MIDNIKMHGAPSEIKFASQIAKVLRVVYF